MSGMSIERLAQVRRNDHLCDAVNSLRKFLNSDFGDDVYDEIVEPVVHPILEKLDRLQIDTWVVESVAEEKRDHQGAPV